MHQLIALWREKRTAVLLSLYNDERLECQAQVADDVAVPIGRKVSRGEAYQDQNLWPVPIMPLDFATGHDKRWQH